MKNLVVTGSRNRFCPCGSGVKYKKCCKGKCQPPRADELREAPRVGEVYLVRGLELPLGFVPIMGPLHNDAVLIGGDAAKDHYHHDPRFTSQEVARQIVLCSAAAEPDPRELLLAHYMPDDWLFAALFLLIVAPGDQPVAQRELTCLRPMPEYLLDQAVDWIDALENAFAGRKVECGKCPHNGLPVDGLPQDPDGLRTCRGHGLRFDRAGCVVRRSLQERKATDRFRALVQQVRWASRGPGNPVKW